VSTTLQVVDAFTDRPFTGNPAAVTILDEFPAEERMQQIAAEMNLSETAFAVARDDGSHDLRWLTPQVEVDLCGHATLATACVLGGSAQFRTRSGLLTCTASDGGWIDMDFPADRPIEESTPATLDQAGVRWFGRGGADVLVEVADASAVRSFVPDFPALAALGSRSVIITARGDRPGVDCVSRVFAPNVGIPEDPVTGSAHCTLAVYWSERLGTDQLVGVQASARGGIVRMRMGGDRVVLSGQAVVVSRVTLLA
jgi:predicted PhzF superfamily epimerase YddE/YHI9